MTPVLPPGGSKDFILPTEEEVKQSSPAAQCSLIHFKDLILTFFNVKRIVETLLYCVFKHTQSALYCRGSNGPDVLLRESLTRPLWR